MDPSVAPPSRQEEERWLETIARDARRKGLRWTAQRTAIAEAFLRHPAHVTAKELYVRIRRRHPKIGMTTVYRTLEMLVGLGYARVLNFEDGRTRYEPRGHLKPHHDHLICIGCGKTIEFFNEELERLQFQAAQEEQFVMTNHRLDIFGYCRECDESAAPDVRKDA